MARGGPSCGDEDTTFDKQLKREQDAGGEPQPQAWRSAAIFAFVASAAFHSLYSFCTKLALRSFPVPQIMWARYGVQFVFTSALLIRGGSFQACGGGACWLLLGRGAFGFLSQVCHTMAVSRLSLADAVSVHTIYPVLTALLAPMLLGEPLTMQAVASAAVATTGCVLITRGELPAQGQSLAEASSAVGLAFALSGALFASLTYILIRRLMRGDAGTVSPELVVWAYAATGIGVLCASLPVTVGLFVVDAPLWAWAALVMVGAVSVAEQMLVSVGFRSVPAGMGTLLLTLETGFAFPLSLIVLKEELRWTALVGGCCIAAAVGSSAVHQMWASRGSADEKLDGGRQCKDGRQKVQQSEEGLGPEDDEEEETSPLVRRCCC